MRSVPGAAIGLSLLDLTVRKMCSNFLFFQELLEAAISSSLISLILRLLPNLRMTLVHLLNKSVSIFIVNFLFCNVFIVACNDYFCIL